MSAPTSAGRAGRAGCGKGAAAALVALLPLTFSVLSQARTVNAICSTDQPWCEAQGQALGATVDSLQVPANKTFKAGPRIPSMDSVKLVKYDFEKYGRVSERKRLIERWTKDVEALPR